MRTTITAPSFVATSQAVLLQMGPSLMPTFDPSFIETSVSSFEREFQQNAAFAERTQNPHLSARAEDLYYHRFANFAHQLEVLAEINRQLRVRNLLVQLGHIASLEGVFHLAADDAIGETDYQSFGSKVADIFVNSLALFCLQLSAPPADLHRFRLAYRDFLAGPEVLMDLREAVAADDLTIPYRPDLGILDADADDAEFRGALHDEDAF
jgi:hypothetical protein